MKIKAAKTALVVLQRARKLITSYRHWTTGAWEETYEIGGKTVTCWCSDGALREAAAPGYRNDPEWALKEGRPPYDTPAYEKATQLLGLVLNNGACYLPSFDAAQSKVIEYNDRSGSTVKHGTEVDGTVPHYTGTRTAHRALLKQFDKAITVAKAIGA